MKIAFLIRDYSPSRGGQERYLSRLIGALASAGNEVHVFAARCEEGAGEGINFHRIPIARGGPFLKTISFILRGRRMLAGGGYDIVSGLTRFYPLDVYRMGGGLHRAWLRKKAGRTAGRLVPYMRPFTWLALYLEGKMFDPANCGYVIANSRLCRDQLLSLYDYPPARTSVIYNGVDHSYFHPGLAGEHRRRAREGLNLSPEATAALFASNNPERKGLDAVLKALALSGNGRRHLLVAGRGRPGGYSAMARRLGVSERVRFLGHLGDMRPAYGASDFLALPTRYDPFANVCLEAMACGLPVITTRDNGASEIIDRGVDGFVIQSARDVSSLARAMDELADMAVIGKMSSAAREKSLAYTVRRNAEETLAVYRKIMEEKSAFAGRS